MSRCRDCTAVIYWTKTDRGATVPLDAEDMGGWDAPTLHAGGEYEPTGRRAAGRYGGTTPEIRYRKPSPVVRRYRRHRCDRPANAATGAASP